MASLLDVSYTAVSVDFHPGQEHKAEPLLQLNPAGTLPVLTTAGGEVYTETQAMLVWLATQYDACLLYTSPSPRDATLSRMPSSA